MDPPSAQPPRVLVVVADPELQDTFLTILREAGYEPHVVATRDEALVRAGEIAFDLVLADLFDRTSPLILTSAHVLQRRVAPTPIGLLATQSCSEEEARAAGFAFVVWMPFDVASLLAQVAAALDQRRPDVRRQQQAVHTMPPGTTTPASVVARAKALIVQSGEVQSTAAELLSQAGEGRAWIRDVQAEAHGVKERAAAARRDAQEARLRAGAVEVAAHEVWVRVRAVAEVVRERTRTIRRRAG